MEVGVAAIAESQISTFLFVSGHLPKGIRAAAL
jgi:hypothetical protein